MNSSRNKDLILSVFSDTRTVFTLNDVAMLIGESEFKKLNERLNYHVRMQGKIQDSKLFKPKDLIGDFGEALVAEVEFPDVRVWGNHADALTLQGRSMKGSDVKQRDDDLARHG